MITGSEFIRIARITGSHALDGKLKVFVVSDIPDRFAKGNQVFLKSGSVYKEYTISDFRFIKGHLGLLNLQGISTRTEADQLKNADIFIDPETAEKGRSLLDEDTFFYKDIIGASVYLHNAPFGKVKDIFEAGSGDILVIEVHDNKEIMVPFVGSMVKTDRLKENIIEITPVEGLIDF